MVRLECGLGVRDRNPEIEIALAQPAPHDFEVCRTGFETHVRPPLTELGQDSGDLDADEIAGKTDAQRLCGRPGTAELCDLVVDRQHASRMCDDRLAPRCQAHARRALVQKVVAEQKLQPFDLRADGRLGDTEHLRSLREAAQVDDAEQRPQQFRRDVQHAPSLDIVIRDLCTFTRRPPPMTDVRADVCPELAADDDA